MIKTKRQATLKYSSQSFEVDANILIVTANMLNAMFIMIISK